MGRENGFTEQLACIDMASRDVTETAAQLRKACVDSGFFYLINHGLDPKLLEEVFAQSKKFFALPLEDKMKVFCDKNQRGWTPFEEETLDPNSQSKAVCYVRIWYFLSSFIDNAPEGLPQWLEEEGQDQLMHFVVEFNSYCDSKEGYYIGVDVPESDPRSKKPLHGPNQWPAPVPHQRQRDTSHSGDTEMPRSQSFFAAMHDEDDLRIFCEQHSQWSAEMLPGWRETMERYHAEALKLCRRVADLIALALNLEEKYFDKPGLLDDALALIRLLHYSEEASNIEKGIYGTGAHSDYGMLTLLATDDVPGLQICKRKDELPQIWEEVPPLKGAYIVNLGDMLERWSNGLFRATLHRVISPGRERYSIPFFFDPNYDCVVKCLPTCCSEDNPPKFAPTTSGEHLLSKYRSTHQAFEANGQKENQ